MFTSLHFTLGAGLVVAISIALFWAFVNHRRHKINLQVATELDTVIASALKLVEQNKKIAQNHTQQIRASQKGDPLDLCDINSPEMLSAMVTTMVNKYGDIRLSLKDFMIGDDEYVSVYLDTQTQEMILSLNHDYGESEDTYTMKFPDTDDNTFH